MRRLVWAGLVIAAVAVAAATWVVRRAEPPTLILPVVEPVADPAETAPSPARPAEEPDAERLAAALELLGEDARESSCGPYALYTDVADRRLLAACDRLASELDDLCAARYGVRPVGEAAEAIVLFSRIDDFRVFARGDGIPSGYAGYAVGGRGFAVFHTDGQTIDAFLATLAHELAHLVLRRSLGPNLPPWLSEGLADAVGDSAGEEGFRPLDRAAGNGAQARRLRAAYDGGRAGGLEWLVGLERGGFDRGTVSYDYEQSALFVRFLLTDPELATRFRSFLGDLAQGTRYSPERLASALAVSWEELDRRFAAWIRSPAATS